MLLANALFECSRISTATAGKRLKIPTISATRPALSWLLGFIASWSVGNIATSPTGIIVAW
jgi:hypothetical protein